jgi:hypothetical protein
MSAHARRAPQISRPLRPTPTPFPRRAQSCAFVFLSVGLEVAFGGWATVYAVKWLGQSEADGHALTSWYWLAFTAGRVVASGAAAALSPAALLLGSMPLAVAGAAAAAARPPASLAGWPAAVAVSLVGAGVSTGFANLLALLERYAPINGGVTGLLSGFAGAGTMLMPLLVAALAKSTPLGYGGLMWTTLGAMLLQFACLAPVLAGAPPPAAGAGCRGGGAGAGAVAAAPGEAPGAAAAGGGDEEAGLAAAGGTPPAFQSTVSSISLPLPPSLPQRGAAAGGR